MSTKLLSRVVPPVECSCVVNDFLIVVGILICMAFTVCRQPQKPLNSNGLSNRMSNVLNHNYHNYYIGELCVH